MKNWEINVNANDDIDIDSDIGSSGIKGSLAVWDRKEVRIVLSIQISVNLRHPRSRSHSQSQVSKFMAETSLNVAKYISPKPIFLLIWTIFTEQRYCDPWTPTNFLAQVDHYFSPFSPFFKECFANFFSSSTSVLKESGHWGNNNSLILFLSRDQLLVTNTAMDAIKKKMEKLSNETSEAEVRITNVSKTTFFSSHFSVFSFCF